MSASKNLRSPYAILSESIQKLHFGVILIVAGLLRAASILVLKTYLHPQTWEFGPLAESINRGYGFAYPRPIHSFYDPYGPVVYLPSAILPPAYPYLLAWFFRVFGERPVAYLSIEFVNASLGVLLVYLVYRTACELLSEKAAKVAAVICAVYPAQVYMCNEFHSINFYIVLGVAVIFFLNRYLNKSNAWIDAVWAGVCMGLLLLFRAEALGPMCVYASCLMIRKGRKSVRPAILFVSISLLCLSPWVIRNYRVFHAFVPTMSTPGWVLWFGHNPLATGSQHYDWYGSIQPELRNELDKVPLNDQFEVEIDKHYKKYALEYIRTHPRREVELAGRKLFLFFFFDPAHVKGSLPSYWIPSILMTCVAVYGAYLQGRRMWREDLLLSVSIAYAIVLGMILIVLPRYKMVVDPFFMIFAAAVVDRTLTNPSRFHVDEPIESTCCRSGR